MSAANSLPSAFGHATLLGVRGAKMYLQVKGGGGGAQAPESQEVLPPDNPMRVGGSKSLMATFTKSPPETKELELKQCRDKEKSTSDDLCQVELNNCPAEPLIRRPAVNGGPAVLAAEPVVRGPAVKRGAPRGRGVRAKSHQGRAINTAAGGRPTKTTESSVGTRRKVRGNRGGRGGVTAGRRELQKILHTRKRELFLSRKYGVIWGEKVFGRVLPSAARRHCDRRLKRQSMTVWTQTWWRARREWKLNIRADCHNRYRLWILVWKYWTEFVSVRKQRRAVKQSATSHNERRLVKRVWGGWCEYQRGKREKRQTRETALQWHLARVLRRGWTVWRQSLERRRGREVMLTTALHHWTTTLLSQVWVHWVEQYRERKADREKMTAAERHWMTSKKATCWSAWSTYVQHRRRKRHLNEVAEKRYSVCVLRRVLDTWRERGERARELAQFQELVEERGRRAIARRALSCWKYYMELALYKEHLMQIATSHHHTVLKSKAVTCLKTYSQRQRLQRQHRTAAEKFRHLKVLGKCWKQWLLRCEHCEEIKMLSHTRRARQHFRLCGLRQFFPVWKAFVVLRRRQKAQTALADQHFKSKALPKCFSTLRDYAGVRSYKRELLCQAQSFRRENLLSMAFYQWWRAFHIAQDVHSMERVAALHCEDVVKRACLRRWRVQTKLRLRQLTLEHSAVVYHRRWVLSSALNKWRDCRQRRLLSVQQYSLAQRHHSHKSMRHIWSAWQEYVGRRRVRKARYARATVHYHRTLLQRALKGWQVHHYCAVRKKEKKSRAEYFYCLLLERSILRMWRENVEWYQLQRHLDRTALAHFEKTTYIKYFSWWREQTVLSMETARRERERVQEITSTLTQKKLARVLVSWREYSTSSVARRIGYERALVHFRRRTLQMCFSAWHDHYRLSIRKMLLARQCAHFLRNRLVSTFYAKWRVELMRAVVVKQKSVLALWHWSKSLQRKALVCWLMYVMNRKRKAERYAEAMKRYRSRLLHIGVTQWIEFATSMQAQRVGSALQHQTQVTQSVLQCVRRCAQRWRDSVRRRRTNPQLGPATTRTKHQPDTRDSAAKDIWATIARKHQILMPVHQRPHPRLPEYMESRSRLSPRLPDSDLFPRSKIPHPPIPPVLYGQQPLENLEGRDGGLAAPSFTFLPSTVSVLSSPPDHQQVRDSDPHSMRGLPPLPPDAHSRDPEIEIQQSPSSPTPLLLPPSAFSNRPTSTSHRGSTDALAGQGAGEGLADPAVRSRIVHVRDELRRYHQTRVKKQALEKQVAHARDSSSPQLAELQADLGRTVEEMHRTEPMLLELVAQVQHHFSQNPT